eukprot:COSAG05_NODE_11794_length_496_cov_0.773300_1_plen_96_part_01
MKYQRNGGYFVADTKSCRPNTTRVPHPCFAAPAASDVSFFGGAICSGAHQPGFSPKPEAILSVSRAGAIVLRIVDAAPIRFGLHFGRADAVLQAAP